MKEYTKTTSLITLLLFFAFSLIACNKNEEPNLPFEGNVIIVGAGVSGLAAAKKFEEQGINYQILEASDKYGGRIQKNVGFADFPIDLGAEWIHEDKSILNYLIDQPGNEPNVATILYQPMNIQEVVGNVISQISNQDMLDYYASYIKEYKFENTTWYDFIDENFAQDVAQNIVYNSKVTQIDYTGDKVILTTENNTQHQADKVIVTVSVGVLKSNAITFNPSLPTRKINAIQKLEFLPGFKLFMKFSTQFYPDVISVETTNGEKTFYDVAYGKSSQDHVLGLLAQGVSAEAYYALGTSDAIVSEVLQELDGYYNGLATQNYLGSYVYQDWGQHTLTQGTWTTEFQSSSNKLNESLDDKIYFAGETYNNHGISTLDGFYIIRGSVQSAIISGYEVVDRVLE